MNQQSKKDACDKIAAALYEAMSFIDGVPSEVLSVSFMAIDIGDSYRHVQLWSGERHQPPERVCCDVKCEIRVELNLRTP